MRIVINTCFGGFNISLLAQKTYLERKGKEAFFYTNKCTPDGHLNFDTYVRVDQDEKEASVTYLFDRDLGEVFDTAQFPNDGSFISSRDIDRSDPDLVAVVEELGAKANGQHAELKIVDIPDDVEYMIEEYDGREWVAEQHRTWS